MSTLFRFVLFLNFNENEAKKGIERHSETLECYFESLLLFVCCYNEANYIKNANHFKNYAHAHGPFVTFHFFLATVENGAISHAKILIVSCK